MRTALFGLVAGIAALAGGSAAWAQDRKEARAAVEITSEKERRGAAAFLDDEWIEGLLERATWREFVVEAAKSARLGESPEFKGTAASDIGWKSGVSVTLDRRPGTGIVVVVATAGTEAQGASVANAVAAWLVAASESEAKRRLAERRSALETRVSVADATIRLLTVDRTGALRGDAAARQPDADTDATVGFDVSRLSQFRQIRSNDSIQLRRELSNDEDTYTAFKSVLGDGGRGLDSLAGNSVVARDEAFRPLQEDLVSAQAHRASLAGNGLAASHPSMADADRKIADARAARDRKLKSIVTGFVEEHEARRARMKRAESDVVQATAELAAALAVKRAADEIDRQLAQQKARKRDAQDALDALAAAADEPGAVRVLTVAGSPPTVR